MGELVKARSKYGDEDRRRAVVEYCVHGLMTKVSAVTGIPDTTLAHWKNKTGWWVELVATVRNEINDQILAQNQTNARMAGDALTDRILNGDKKLVKVKRAIKNNDGALEMSEDYELRTEPMRGRDLAIAGGISQDKAMRGMGLPTSIVGSSTSVQGLAAEFRKLYSDHQSIQNSVVATQHKVKISHNGDKTGG